MVRLFFGLYLYLAEKCCENPHSIKGPAQCKSGSRITYSQRKHLLCHFSIAILLHLASFYAKNTFEKKAKGNAHWTNYCIWIEGPGPPGRTCTPIPRYFHDKTKISNKPFSGLLFTAKILHEAVHLTSPTWAKSLTKFNIKIQDFERVLDLNCKQNKNWTI